MRVTDLTVRLESRHPLGMVAVNVATLKQKLSHYLKLVKRGEEVVVTSHRHPIARILPWEPRTAQIIEPTRPTTDVLKVTGVQRRRSVAGVHILLADRRRR
ncbi:MAG: type II toxin-antitoxin system Phd/YefM family antitoxin [Gammaproteobacteria bacterium]